MSTKSFLLGFLAAIAAVAIIGGSFYAGKKGLGFAENPTPTPQVINEPEITPADAITGQGDEEEAELAIESSLETGAYIGLRDYLADEVNFRIEASGCCPPMSPGEAIEQLAFLDSAETPWNFDQESETALELAATYPEYYSDAFIAIADNNYSAAFKYNDEGLIDTISVSNDYTTLLP